MDAVGFSESAPPLYYALAWLWTQLTGTGEFGLRSLSALAGVATVPVAYLLATELTTRRVGRSRPGSPPRRWSRSTRCWSGTRRRLGLTRCSRCSPRSRCSTSCGRSTAAPAATSSLWGACLGLGPGHALLRRLPDRRRGALAAAPAPPRGGAAASPSSPAPGLLLAPLAIHQMSIGHAEWIGNFTLGHRLWETGLTFMLGETGDIIARPEHPLLALVPCLLAVAALALVFSRGERPERRAAGDPARARRGDRRRPGVPRPARPRPRTTSWRAT